MQVLVPVKSFAHAKSRLGPIFDSGVRRQLARAMAQSVLTELRLVSGLRRILVVSSEPEMREFCLAMGTDYLWDDGAGGLNGALAAGELELRPRDDEPLAVVCADLPFFRAAEFERILVAHAGLGPQGLTLASDQHRRGTNVRIATVPGGLPYRFGESSAPQHLREARRRGVPCQLFKSEAFALDLDTPHSVFDVVQRYEAAEKAPDNVLFALQAGLAGERRDRANTIGSKDTERNAGGKSPESFPHPAPGKDRPWIH